MTRDEAYIKYYNVIQDLTYYIKTIRAIARDNHTSISTVMRISVLSLMRFQKSRKRKGSSYGRKD